MMGHHLLLVPLVATAALTIVDDLRHGKIYNHRLAAWLAVGVVGYGILWAVGISGVDPAIASCLPEGVHGNWIAVVGQNLAIALGAGIALWLLGVWAAGDAKLFALYAFLVPPACYTRSWLPAFPALPLLVNVFALVFLFLLADLARTGLPAIIRTLRSRESRARVVKDAPKTIAGWLPVMLVFLAMFAGIRSLREVSREGLGPLLKVSDFTLFVLLFVVFKPLTKLAMKKWGAIAFSVLSLSAIVFLGWRHGIGFLPGLLKPGAMAIVLLVFARAYPSLGSTSIKVKVRDLRPGLMLGRETLMSLRSREAREATLRGGLKAEEEEPGTTAVPPAFGEMTAEGLSDEQIRFIRTRWKDDEILVIERMMPFSPFLAAGALLTYFLGGPVTLFVSMN